MNLKVPTLPLSIPIHVPIGGLLMMSMTSPLCNTGRQELKEISSPRLAPFTGLTTRSYLQFEGVRVVGTGGEVGMN